MAKKIKLKTHRGAAKRFKRTKRGKFLRGSAFKQHILSSKTRKRKRGLRGTTQALLKIGDDIFERNALGRYHELRHLEIRRPTDVIGNQFDPDARPGREHDGPLDHVFQLANVPWPIVLSEQVERIGRELEIRFSVLVTVLVQEMLHQQRNVVLSISKRWQLNRDDVQPVEQILAKLSFFHHLPQVDGGCGDDPRIDLDRLHAAEPHEVALLDDAK